MDGNDKRNLNTSILILHNRNVFTQIRLKFKSSSMLLLNNIQFNLERHIMGSIGYKYYYQIYKYQALLFIPKRHKITSTDFFINCSHLVEWPRTQSEQLNPYHLQEMAKTHLFIFIWPLTLALSILNVFDLICLLFFI